MNPWKLYDKLIATVDDDKVSRVRIGASWTMVETESGRAGLASSSSGGSVITDMSQFAGMPLSRAAEMIKSWDFSQAAIGLAAINAHLNRGALFGSQQNPDAFLRYRDMARGKKVGVVGHFAYLESRLAGICDMCVLERKPSAGDYPDPACEYLLPEMDVVFITGSAVINKTMPRLLELCKNAFTVICGPSTPMDGVFFEMGADALCGFCVNDARDCLRLVAQDAAIFPCGQMVCVERGEIIESLT
ncbi:MAG: DUF364 domain-containing protein [Clostridia bacterium]|nr:DUF364 domain-containing protein [Clostridia bacterium]